MKNTGMKMWMEAAAFAARRHSGQYRRDGATPYVAHPFRVAMIVRNVFGESDPVVLSAALLHDVIEDTGSDYEKVAERFGQEVAELVVALTKDPRLPKPAQMAAYDRQLAEASWQARLIKMADAYDNVLDAPDDKVRAGARAKAERVLGLAGNDPKLATAAAALRGVMEDSKG
jgi:(p)ppGpp synthase/HD superfamily hydrolase